tara:strand:- start:3432 stop:3629 length:198 start_codon:yes stop_codon:yes gene_type:complete
MKITLELIQEQIAELRDSDEHICPFDTYQQLVAEGYDTKNIHNSKCSCEKYDYVIDLIDEYKESK